MPPDNPPQVNILMAMPAVVPCKATIKGDTIGGTGDFSGTCVPPRVCRALIDRMAETVSLDARHSMGTESTIGAIR